MKKIIIFLLLLNVTVLFSQEKNISNTSSSSKDVFIDPSDPNDPIELDPLDPPSCRNFYYDGDGDGFGAGTPVCYVTPPFGWVKFGNDCDDNDPNLFPKNWYVDNDGDGFGVIGSIVKDCYQPLGRVSNFGDCNDNDFNINPNTTWYSDYDNDGFGDPQDFLVQCAQPSNYVLNNLDSCPNENGGFSNNGCPIFSDENYVYTKVLNAPQNDINQVNTTPSLESVIYYDDIGREKQKIDIKNSPNGRNVIQHIEYDVYGRKTKDYLPYESNALGAFFQNNALTETENYYLNKFSENNPFTEKNYEKAPLDRILETGAPGSVWEIDPFSDNDHTIKFLNSFNTVADNVKSFGVAIDLSGNYDLVDEGYYNENELAKYVIKNENWSPTQTYINDNTVIEFKDKLDRIVLKRTFNSNKNHDTYYVYDKFGNLAFVLSPEINTYDLSQQIWAEDYVEFEDVEWYYSANPTGGWTNFTELSVFSNQLYFYFENGNDGPNVPLNTSGPVIDFNYVGFDVDLPDMVLGPVTIKLSDGTYSDSHYQAYIQNGTIRLSGDGTVAYGLYIDISIDLNTLSGVSTYIITDSDINKLGYRYKYDQRNRLVEKKLPGKEWEYIVYDKLDRPILTQDANLKDLNKWRFIKYDIFDRITYSGIWTNPVVNQSRADVQLFVDTQSSPVWHEQKLVGTANNINGTVVMYTNQTFPNVPSSLEVLTIQYYDNYDFDIAGLSVESSYGINPISNIKGLAAGSKTRILGTNNWITSLVYYDDKERPIFTASINDYIGIVNKVKLKLGFTGNTLESETNHIKSGLTTVINDYFTYDHVNRLLTHKQKINGVNEQLIVKNEYDELGQLLKKRVGNNEVNPLQDVDYKYNIRGWLKEVNEVEYLGEDLFSYEINYQDANTPYTYNGAPGTALYNGNISSINWSSNNSSSSIRNYYYKYDALNRLTDAYYGENSIVSYKFNERVGSYDRNGNIKNLYRYSANPSNPNSTSYVGIDALVYTYDGNQLLGVKDNYGLSTNGAEGFKDNNTTAIDYSYDDNGNLTEDKNKGITSIDYNQINLPTKIVFNNQDPLTAPYPKAILYKYDAMGTKIEKTVLEPKTMGGVLQNTVTTTTYSGSFIYKNNELQFFSHPEGYVAHNAGIFSYIYQYKDHLGNVRLTYSDANNDGQITGETSDVFFSDFENGSGWESGTYWNSATVVYDATKKHSGLTSGKIENLTASEQVAHQTNWVSISNTQPTDYIFSAWVYSDNPSAELFLFQNEDTDLGYGYANQHVQTTQKNKWVYMEKRVTVQPNITRLLLRLDNNGGGTVWFDDVSLRKVNTSNEIVEENNYYPFGLKHKHYNNVVNLGNANDLAQNYKFGGKEYDESLGINTYDFGARNYDPALGRWMNIDPLAEQMRRHSPYNYAFDNPIYFIDPDGMKSEDWYQDEDGYHFDPDLTAANASTYLTGNQRYAGKDFVDNEAGLAGDQSGNLYDLNTGEVLEAFYNLNEVEIVKTQTFDWRENTIEATGDINDYLAVIAESTRGKNSNLLGATKLIGYQIEVLKIGIAVEKDNLTLGSNTQIALGKTAGGIAGGIAGAEVGAFIGGWIGGGIGFLCGGVNAIPGVIIGQSIGAAIGGYFGAQQGSEFVGDKVQGHLINK